MEGLDKHQKLLNEKARDEFFRLVERENIPLSNMEKEIVSIFFSSETHFTIGEMQRKLADKGVEITKRDVVSVLELLLEFGFAKKSEFEDIGEVVYEHRHLTEHHDHMVCIKCDRIIEFFVPRLEKMQSGIADEFHFHSLNHKLEIYGICGDCRGKMEPVIPLVMASPGEKVVVKEIRGGKEINRRLNDMGLVPGTSIEIITNSGQVIVSVKNTRIAIGRGIASKVIVALEDNMKD